MVETTPEPATANLRKDRKWVSCPRICGTAGDLPGQGWQPALNRKPQDKTSREKVLDLFVARATRVMDDPKRVKAANQSIMKTLLRHIDQNLPAGDFTGLPTPSLLEEQENTVLASFLALQSILESLRQCEFYFRRYPFADLPVSRNEHLRNICEMYFDRIYQLKVRLKITLNLLKRLRGVEKDERFGSLIKAFERALDWELRQRNATHHTRRFEYDAIDQLGLIDLLQHSEMAEILPTTSTRCWPTPPARCANSASAPASVTA